MTNAFFTKSLANQDPDIFKSIEQELARQRHEIELIASENIVSRAVLEAQGSVLTNKYAEGYPGKRYYGGCQFVDIAENLAIDRAKTLLAAALPMFSQILVRKPIKLLCGARKAGDTLLGMSLDAGGHLTHGAKPNISGKWFNAVQYGVVAQTGLLDYEQVEALAIAHKPKIIIAGGSAILVRLILQNSRDSR